MDENYAADPETAVNVDKLLDTCLVLNSSTRGLLYSRIYLPTAATREYHAKVDTFNLAYPLLIV